MNTDRQLSPSLRDEGDSTASESLDVLENEGVHDEELKVRILTKLALLSLEPSANFYGKAVAPSGAVLMGSTP